MGQKTNGTSMRTTTSIIAPGAGIGTALASCGALGAAATGSVGVVAASAVTVASVAVPFAALAGAGYGLYKLGRFLFSDDE